MEEISRGELESCINGGMTVKEIAAVYGIPVRRVYKLRYRYGMTLPNTLNSRNSETVRRFKTLYEQGLTYAEIGRELGISEDAAYYLRKKWGLKGRNRPRGALLTSAELDVCLNCTEKNCKGTCARIREYGKK